MLKDKLTTLNKVDIGTQCVVSNIDKQNNNTLNRMYDFGIVKNTVIIPLNKSMFGDTVAYLVRGTVVAIRKEEAEKIKVII